MKAREHSKESYLTGSYSKDDCIFLLKPIETEFLSVGNKERLIQSGEMHYSQVISKEKKPSKAYIELFLEFTELYKRRLASEIMLLARKIFEKRGDSPTVVSLARAGTPIGVLVNRALKQFYCDGSKHYSVSIIRDKGIDQNAIKYILDHDKRDPDSVVFIDGWTGKGIITKELKDSIEKWNNKNPDQVMSDELFVVSDIGATAAFSATTEDYVIPCGIMNSTVSGLVSRTILNESVSASDFHACVEYKHLLPYDFSNWFVDEISNCFNEKNIASEHRSDLLSRRREVLSYLDFIKEEYNISDINRIKPSIAEATRVLLRRVPDILIVKDLESPYVRHLVVIANEKKVGIEVRPEMPFNAISLIKDVD